MIVKRTLIRHMGAFSPILVSVSLNQFLPCKSISLGITLATGGHHRVRSLWLLFSTPMLHQTVASGRSRGRRARASPRVADDILLETVGHLGPCFP